MKFFSFLNYSLFIAAITILLAVVYATVQQSYRTGANDPQIQLTEDISNKIRQGQPIENIFRADTIDIAQSLSPFAVLYDASGSPTKSTGYLNGKMAQLPAGVFEVAKQNGQDRVTWQPRRDVRVAMVVYYINSAPAQFVAAGRSLREVEDREYNLRKMIFMGWIICMGLVMLNAGLQSYQKRENP